MNRSQPTQVDNAPPTADPRSQGSTRNGHRAPHHGFFTALWLIYAVYVLVFWLSTGWSEFFSFPDWRVFQRLFLLAAPLYILVLWQQRRILLPMDKYMTYVPVLVWLVVTYTRLDVSKGLMNFVVVEPPIVGLLYGLQLARFFVGNRLSARGRRIGAWVGAVCLTLLAALVAFIVPGVPD